MALDNFFKLNGDPLEISTQEDFLSKVNGFSEIEDMVYLPDDLKRDESFRGLMKKKKFKNVSFSKTNIENINFRDCEFIDCLFIGTQFKNCEFHKCRFIGCNPYKIIFEKCYIDPDAFKNLLDEKKYTNIGLHLFNQLTKNSRNEEYYHFLKKASYLYQCWIRYDLNRKLEQRELSWVKWFIRWLPSVIYDGFAGYGWRTGRFIAWSIVLIFSITSVNHFFWDGLGMIYPEAIVTPSWIASVYFSIVTITTLGYGDITPTTYFGMLLASFEGIIGLIWLSMLASVVFHRLFR